jgi:hypothetical protein
MAHADDERKEISALLSRPFIGACSLVIVLAGAVVGDKFIAIKDDLTEIRATLNSRADLPPRTTELERRDADKEGRLREIERDHWRFKTH